MLVSGVNLKPGQLLAPQTVIADHALDGQVDDFARVFLHHALKRSGLSPPGVAGMAEIKLLIYFISGQAHLLCVGNDDKIAAIDTIRIDRLVLTPQKGSGSSRHAAQNLAFGVKMMPASAQRGLLRLMNISFLRHDKRDDT